jgi:hypothetical protein
LPGHDVCGTAEQFVVTKADGGDVFAGVWSWPRAVNGDVLHGD